MSPRPDYMIRSPHSRNLTGAQLRLDGLVLRMWPQEQEHWRRPRVMAVRDEAGILEYVSRILQIRDRAEQEGHTAYTAVEQEMLRMAKGRLPSAIAARASYDYRTSARVVVAELRYGGDFRQLPSIALAEWKERNDLLYSNFLHRLTESDLRAWEEIKEWEVERVRRASKATEKPEDLRVEALARFA